MARLRIETAPQVTVYDESVVFKAAAGATANVLEIKNSSDTVVASIGADGNTVIAGNLSVTGTTTVSANANTLTGATLKSTVLNSSLTSVGTLSSLAVSGSATIAANLTANNATITNNLTVGGNLSVTGSIITVDTTTLMVEDNKIVINSTASGAPSVNGVIEVERGSSDNVSIRWNETTDAWQLTNDGTTFADVQASITAGAGLSRTANTINVVSANSSRINVGAGNIDLATVTQSNTSGTAGVSFVQSHSVDAYGRIDGTVTASIRDANTTVKGIALFSDADFAVTSGEVTIKASGVDNAQLANSSMTINGTAINLGSTATITAAAGTLTGTGLAATVVSSSLTSVGTITSGTWNGTAIAIANGGTGQSSATGAINALLPAQATASGQYLTSNGTATNWGTILLSHVSGVTTTTQELNYVGGVTSPIQTQLNTKAPLASPTFTGTVTIPSGASISGFAPLASPTFTGTVSGITKTMVGLGNVDNTGDAAKPVSADQQAALNLKANIASPTFTGVVTIPANAIIAGYATTMSPTLSGTPTAPTAAAATNTTQIATTAFVRAEVAALVGSAGSTLDTLGEIATALGNDASLSATLTTSIGLKAPIASPTFTGNVTIPAGAIISGYVTLTGSETLTNKTFTSPVTNSPTLTLATSSSTTDARISWDTTNKKLQVGNGTISLDFASSNIVTNAQAASYTAILGDKDKLVEISNASANNLTVPPNSSVAFPVGTQIRILQTGAGQTTVAAGAGVTINSTPGLKLRAQWSSATLIKRATDTWVLIGDLAA
jgi:hypothetical protein